MYIHNCKCIYTTVYAYSVKGSFRGILHSGRTFWRKTLGNMYIQIIYTYIYTYIQALDMSLHAQKMERGSY